MVRRAEQFQDAEVGDGHLSEVVERFWQQVRYTDEPGCCWLWNGVVDPQGRGRFTIPRRRAALPPRVAYEMVHGALPHGWHVTHTCEQLECVNPEHLRAVTHAQRGAILGRRRRISTRVV